MRARDIFIAVVFCLYFSSFVFALELVSPSQGTEVHPGDTVKVIVVPSPGEEVGSVHFDGLFGGVDETPPYEYEYKIGPRDIGDIVFHIFSLKPFNEEPKDINSVFNHFEVDLRLKSTLPPTTKVVSIGADFTGRKETFLAIARKPNGELVVTEGTHSTNRLSVGATYSDDVGRNFIDNPDVTYKSLNEKVAIVFPPGQWSYSGGRTGTSYALVKATGPGKTSIIVQYGEFTDRVTVNVKECPYIEGETDKHGCPLR